LFGLNPTGLTTRSSRFRAFILRWEQNSAPPPAIKPAETALWTTPDARRWGQCTNLEAEEESYFNGSDDEEDIATSLQPTVSGTVTITSSQSAMWALAQPDRPPSATSSHMYNNMRRPDAPIPPTPQSSTFFSSVAPTPYPLVFSPAPAPPLPASAIAATPAPGPQFASFVPRHGDFVEPALPTSTTAAAPPSPI
jgi:hypothetical protein